MAPLAKFLRRSRDDRRMLAAAAIVHVIVAIAVRALPFGLVRQLLDRAAAFGRSARAAGDVDARVIRAARSVSAVLPGATCLTEALVAGVLLGRAGCETTLCFGVSGAVPADRPFDAHAWLERRGVTVVGARGVAYDPLASPTRCVSSPLPR
jgi:hypothetical protein